MNHPSNTQTFNPAIPTEMKTIAQVVLNGLQSPKSKRIYMMALRDFLNYWAENGSPVPDKLFLQTYVFHMLETGVGRVSINIRLAAIKNFSREAADMNIWPYEVPTAFSRMKKIAVRGTRSGTWLTMEQAQSLMMSQILLKFQVFVTGPCCLSCLAAA